MLKDITKEPIIIKGRDKEFAEKLIDKLIAKAGFNSRNDVQHSLSYLFYNPQHWMARIIPGLDSKHYTSFIAFAEAAPPWGLGWTKNTLEAFLIPGKEEMWADIEEQTPEVKKPGEHKGNQYTKNGMCTRTHSISKGNSRERLIARLKKNAPAIAKKVIAGEISAAEGMRQAGKKKPVITIPLTVEGFAKAINNKLSDEQRTELKQMIT